MYSDDELELPDWIIEDDWVQELGAWVWEQVVCGACID
jgi:hypothetical protein